MTDDRSVDSLFREAVAAIDAGDLPSLVGCLTAHPRIACERLETPGSWLRDEVGTALDSFFGRPYLLWFVAEDPVRTGRLPQNIAELAAAILEAARACDGSALREQVDYATALVAWSGVAARSGSQIALLKLLADAGANLDGTPDKALVNGRVEAARYLVERGATLTLGTALCLSQWAAAERLLQASDLETKQFALVLAALNGKAEAVGRLISVIPDLSEPSKRLYSHATPLHHAVWSGALDAVSALVEAGADLNARDTLYGGTPLGWAEHAAGEAVEPDRIMGYRAIADYLQKVGAAR